MENIHPQIDISKIVDEATEKTLIESEPEIKILENKIILLEKSLADSSLRLNMRAELLLNHLDILLESTKNFLIVFSTIFTASIALKDEVISNINLNTIKIVSGSIVLVSIIAIIIILIKRNSEKEKIYEHISFLGNANTDILKMRHELLGLRGREFREVLKKAGTEAAQTAIEEYVNKK